MKKVDMYQISVKAICEVMESNGYATEIREEEIIGSKRGEKISFSPDLLIELCGSDSSYDELIFEMSLIIELLPVMDIDRIKPYLITENERINLDDEIYIETIEDGRHIAFHDSMVRYSQPFLTKKEAQQLSKIRETAFQNLEEVEEFEYSLNRIEGGRVARILDEHRHVDPRIALVTNNIFKILRENYQDHAHLVTTPRGDLFVFSIDEDPNQVVDIIMDSKVGLLSERFDILEYHDRHIRKLFTISSGRKFV